MNYRWRIDLWIFIACMAGLLTGAVLWLTGWRTQAQWAWLAGSVPAVLVLLLGMIAALRRREAGVDVLALVSIGGALLLQQELTAAVIAVMLASGHLLESFAERRAGREMAALLERAPALRRDSSGRCAVHVPAAPPSRVRRAARQSSRAGARWPASPR